MKRCPNCHNDVKKKKFGIYYKCLNCGILIRDRELDKGNIDLLYQKSWIEPHLNIYETGGTTTNLAKKYLNRLKKSIKIKDFSGLTVLDFGAGRGEFTSILQYDDAEVFAVEPYGYEYLKDRHKNTFRCLGDINTKQSFHGIVSLNVIEHLTSPWIDLNELREVLIPGGWLFLVTPNSNGLNAKINSSGWREAKREGHLYLFNRSSLTKILSDCGFHKIQWLRWYFPYNDRLITNIKDWILQNLRFDGELKFLAYKPAD